MQDKVWFIRPLDASKRLRLFCFPYAGGSATLFLPWSNRLPDIDICPIQLPGRSTRFGEAAYTEFETLIDDLLPVIAVHTTIPFSFFGHSMGAKIAFRLAQRLRRDEGSCPTSLIVSASAAPTHLNPRQWHLQDDAALIRTLRLYQGTPEEVLDNEELMSLLLPTLRADFQLLASVHFPAYEPPLPCPIHVLSASDDPHVLNADCYAWHLQSSVGCDLKCFKGGHLFINERSDELFGYLRGVLDCDTQLAWASKQQQSKSLSVAKMPVRCLKVTAALNSSYGFRKPCAAISTPWGACPFHCRPVALALSR